VHRFEVIIVFASLACACGPTVVVGSDATSGTPTTSGEMSTTTSGDTTVQPETTPTTDGTASTSGDPTADFLQEPDFQVHPGECSLWEQNCPDGEKCMPWSSTGGGELDARRCSPIAENPREVGEPCMVEGSFGSGVDDCVLGSMCWDVDPKTNMGECVAFCEGSEAKPSCTDPCTSCSISGSGVLILCLPDCDPLAQDCGEEQGCYPLQSAFACAPDVSGDMGAIGSPCEYINVCDPGTHCADAALVPGCEAISCCTPFCDVEQPDTCDALVPGTTCTPWYEDGRAPGECFGMGTVGACIDAK
jgi:hypothetical protein